MAADHLLSFFLFIFFNDTATPEIYTLSLHDALPISATRATRIATWWSARTTLERSPTASSRNFADHTGGRDRKSTRLNSSHGYNSHAVFCLQKKPEKNNLGRCDLQRLHQKNVVRRCL